MKCLLAVLLVASSFARADLTQAQMEQAVANGVARALLDYSYGAGTDGLMTVPIDGDWEAFLSEYLSSSGQPHTIGKVTYDIYRTLVQTINPSIVAVSNSILRQTTAISSVISNQQARLALSISNDVQQIADMLSDLDDVIRDSNGYLMNCAYALTDIDYQTDVMANALTSTFDNLEVVISNSLSRVYEFQDNLYSYFSQQFDSAFEDLSDVQQDIRSNTDDILDYLDTLPYDLALSIVNALSGVSLSVAVDWSTMPSPLPVHDSAWESTFHPYSLSVISNLTTQTDYQARFLPYMTNVAYTLRDHAISTSNFLARILPTTQENLDALAAYTNAMAEIEEEEAEVSNEVAQASSYLDDEDEFAEVFNSDYTPENPWDNADNAVTTIKNEIVSSLRDPVPDYSTEVVLMGSNDPNDHLPQNRSGSRVYLQPLPRISFDVEGTFDGMGDGFTARVKSIMSMLWHVVGWFMKGGLAVSWLAWFSNRSKK